MQYFMYKVVEGQQYDFITIVSMYKPSKYTD